MTPPDSTLPRLSRRDRAAALYATARALTALGEVDEVLAAIVKQAHELMDVDLTYLSVIDGAELQLRAVEGSISAAFRTARVSASTGIGGQVIEKRAPSWVSNYLTADVLEHSPEFDQVVREEGLVSLLGVPLLAKDRTLGVLYCAHRVEHSYTKDEVALFSAFADHASVALENARLYDESRAALNDLRHAYAMIERSGHVHEALTKVILTGGVESDVAALLTDALGGRVTMLDRSGGIVASRTAATYTSSTEPAGSQGVLDESRVSGRPAVERIDAEWVTAVTVTAGESSLGAMIWAGDAEPTVFDLRTLERASQIVGLLALKQDATVQAEERLRGSVLTELLRAPAISPELSARAQAIRLELDGFNSIIVVKSAHPTAEVARRLRDAARDWRGLVGEHHGVTAFVLHADDLDLAVRGVHRVLEGRQVTDALVVGAPAEMPGAGFGRAFELAERCADVLALAGVSDRATTTTENGLYAVLFDPDRADELDRFFESSLGPVTRYDAQYRTALVATLESYFANSSNVARTARELHVHTNTLLKRLSRVESLLGADWASPDRALALQLAIRLHQLRGAMFQ